MDRPWHVRLAAVTLAALATVATLAVLKGDGTPVSQPLENVIYVKTIDGCWQGDNFVEPCPVNAPHE